MRRDLGSGHSRGFHFLFLLFLLLLFLDAFFFLHFILKSVMLLLTLHAVAAVIAVVAAVIVGPSCLVLCMAPNFLKSRPLGVTWRQSNRCPPFPTEQGFGLLEASVRHTKICTDSLGRLKKKKRKKEKKEKKKKRKKRKN